MMGWLSGSQTRSCITLRRAGGVRTFQALVRSNPAFQDQTAIEASITLISTMGGVGDAQLARTGGYVAGEAVGKLRRRMLTVST